MSEKKSNKTVLSDACKQKYMFPMGEVVKLIEHLKQECIGEYEYSKGTYPMLSVFSDEDIGVFLAERKYDAETSQLIIAEGYNPEKDIKCYENMELYSNLGDLSLYEFFFVEVLLEVVSQQNKGSEKLVLYVDREPATVLTLRNVLEKLIEDTESYTAEVTGLLNDDSQTETPYIPKRDLAYTFSTIPQSDAEIILGEYIAEVSEDEKSKFVKTLAMFYQLADK